MRALNVTMNAQKSHNSLTLVPTFIYRMDYKRKHFMFKYMQNLYSRGTMYRYIDFVTST